MAATSPPLLSISDLRRFSDRTISGVTKDPVVANQFWLSQMTESVADARYAAESANEAPEMS